MTTVFLLFLSPTSFDIQSREPKEAKMSVQSENKKGRNFFLSSEPQFSSVCLRTPAATETLRTELTVQPFTTPEYSFTYFILVSTGQSSCCGQSPLELCEARRPAAILSRSLDSRKSHGSVLEAEPE